MKAMRRSMVLMAVAAMVAQAGTVAEAAPSSHVTCATTISARAFQPELDAPPVGYFTAKGLAIAEGNCASPLVAQQYEVQTCVGQFGFDASTGGYDTQRWANCSLPLPAIAGQGANVAVGFISYPQGAYPNFNVRFCAWVTLPYDSYNDRTCEAPQPAI